MRLLFIGNPYAAIRGGIYPLNRLFTLLLRTVTTVFVTFPK